VTTLAVWLIALPGFLAAYAYVGYPLLLLLVATVRRGQGGGEGGVEGGGERVARPSVWPPMVSLTIPVFNEERRIRAKLEEVLACDYPRDHLQVLVVSDASTDGTDAVVREFASRGVDLVRLPVRGGKTAAENAALPHLRGEIVVNSDASISVPPEALRRLVDAFQDPTVAVASGRDLSVTRLQAESNQGESSYVGYEMWVRRLETRAAGIVGASGCFYAVRITVQRIGIPEALSRDFAAPLVAREQGFRSVSVDGAVAHVPRMSSLRREYRRKVRTMTRGIETLLYKRALLDPFRYGLFAWQLWSHKVARWLVPWAGLLAALGAAMLALQASWAAALIVVMAVSAAVAVVGWHWPEDTAMPRLVAVPAFLVTGNLAVIHATLNAVRGERHATWEPTRRERPSGG